MKQKKRLFILLLTLIMAAVLGGCKDSKPEGEDGDSSLDATKYITSGGRVTVGITQDLDSLDPHNVVYAGTREVLFNMYEGLVKPDSSGELQPAVASKYQISEDGKTYTFTLRKGIQFQDESLVTAEDVKYSIERYADIQGEESAFSILKEVRIADAETIVVELTEGNTEFLANLTCAIIPKSNADPSGTPIGTGPFAYQSFQAGVRLVVKKNEHYWKKDCPYLDEVTFKICTDTDAALLEMKSGTIDIYQYLTNDQADTLKDFQILTGSVNYVQGLFLNNQYEPFKDVRVRQALNYAVDKNQINEFLFNGKSHLLGTNMIPAFKKYYDESTENTYSYDVQKAKKLLADAGYPDGFELKITVPNNYAPHATAAEVIVENLKEIGVKATIEQVEFTTWYSEVYTKRDYEATVVAVDGTLAPSSWFEKNESTNSNNFTNYSNEEYDKVFKEAIKSTDEEVKVKKYKELQQILAQDAASVYLEDPANLVAVNKKLGGYEFYPVAAQDLSVVGFTANEKEEKPAQ